MMAVFFFIAHEKGFKFHHAQPQSPNWRIFLSSFGLRMKFKTLWFRGPQLRGAAKKRKIQTKKNIFKRVSKKYFSHYSLPKKTPALQPFEKSSL